MEVMLLKSPYLLEIHTKIFMNEMISGICVKTIVWQGKGCERRGNKIDYELIIAEAG